MNWVSVEEGRTKVTDTGVCDFCSSTRSTSVIALIACLLAL
mgnify:CR=1 FL=1